MIISAGTELDVTYFAHGKRGAIPRGFYVVALAKRLEHRIAGPFPTAREAEAAMRSVRGGVHGAS